MNTYSLDQVESHSKGQGADEVVQFRSISTLPDDDSKWVEGVVAKTGEPWLETPVLLFYTGTHKGEKYTKDCLAKMDAQHVPPKGERDWDSPGQLDHSESSRDTIAHLRKTWLEADGDQLWGTARFIGVDEVRNVKNGKWRKVSLSVYKSTRRIREFSITPFPHLTEASVFSESTETESEDSMAKEATSTTEAPKEETKDTTPTPKTEQVESFAESAMKAQIEKFAETTRQLAEAQAREAALKAQNAQLEQANAEKDQVIRFAAVTAEIDKFSQAGKILPTERETELALVQTFSESQMDLWRKAKEARPAAVTEDVLGSQDPGDVDKFRAERRAEEQGQSDAKAVGKSLAERNYKNYEGKDAN